MGDTIQEVTLRELVSTNSVHSAHALGRTGGFALAVRCGAAERFLASARSNVRLFPNLTNLALYLRKIGITQFEVNAANYEPGRVRSPRPDRAEALKRTRTRQKQANLFEG
jgi:hypothetical protein